MRTIVFVDYWNLQATLKQEDGKEQGLSGKELREHRFDIDWYGIGPTLTRLAAALASPDGTPLPLEYQQARIYTSADPSDGRFKHWALNNLGRRPGIRVSCLDRRPKRHAVCACCHNEMNACPHCHNEIDAMQEKGVDTMLVTDLLTLGLGNSYDVAVLVSQDSDMAPAAEHLAQKGIKVIQIGLRHFGRGLANHCWADFDLFPIRDQVKR